MILQQLVAAPAQIVVRKHLEDRRIHLPERRDVWRTVAVHAAREGDTPAFIDRVDVPYLPSLECRIEAAVESRKTIAAYSTAGSRLHALNVKAQRPVVLGVLAAREQGGSNETSDDDSDGAFHVTDGVRRRTSYRATCASVTLCSTANTAASTRDDSDSLDRMCRTCSFTVSWLMPSARAMALLLMPAAT